MRRGFLTPGGLGRKTKIRSHLGGLRQFDRTWGHDGNSIALGGITAIRSHLGVLRQFDRTWGDYGNSIALGGITAIRSHLGALRQFIAQFRFDRADRHNHSMGRS
ncbi:hypothetical protein [Microcoleus sp. B9-D4]|uniref:hypothetical protein n=1 Tax=Microcoleus sp. B9-D4 TaxID=2818711 RepID=UPI002FD57515